MMEPTRPALIEIRSLTSLRFFAAAAIVYSHIYTVTGTPFEWMRHVVLLQGVSFFFVLSGFILSVTYHNFDLGRGKRRFYHARFARIYPLYLVAICVGLCSRVLTFGTYIFGEPLTYSSIVVELLMLQAWFPFGVAPINGVGWSISAEAFFYAIFPYIKRSRAVFGLVFALSATFVISICIFGQRYGLKPGVGVGSFFKILYLDPLVRSMEFLSGVWLGTSFASNSQRAAVARGGALSWTLAETGALLACWKLSAYSFSVWAEPSTDYILGGAWKTILLGTGATPGFAALVWVFAHERGYLSRAMRWPPLVFLGASSYALYLFHVSIFEILSHFGGLPAYGTIPAVHRFVLATGLIGLMLGAASFGHVLIEQPLRAWLRNRIQKRQPMNSVQPWYARRPILLSKDNHQAERCSQIANATSVNESSTTAVS